MFHGPSGVGLCSLVKRPLGTQLVVSNAKFKFKILSLLSLRIDAHLFVFHSYLQMHLHYFKSITQLTSFLTWILIYIVTIVAIYYNLLLFIIFCSTLIVTVLPIYPEFHLPLLILPTFTIPHIHPHLPLFLFTFIPLFHFQPALLDRFFWCRCVLFGYARSLGL